MKVTVRYDHDPADLSPIYLSTSADPAAPADWAPAYRDTVGGVRVVWAKFPDGDAPYVWLRDSRGGRRVDSALT